MNKHVGTLLLAFWSLLESSWAFLYCTSTIHDEIPEAGDEEKASPAVTLFPEHIVSMKHEDYTCNSVFLLL